jgi:putative transposase
VVLDSFFRHVVGWSIDASQASFLVTNALSLAVCNRRPTPPSYIATTGAVHVWALIQRARLSGLVPSMGIIGGCYDNGMTESLWGRMQAELVDRRKWETRSG